MLVQPLPLLLPQRVTNSTPLCFDCSMLLLPCAPLSHWMLPAGMSTATSAAAAGGITTVIDMPLNSFPTTTNAEELLKKMAIAEVCVCVCVCRSQLKSAETPVKPSCGTTPMPPDPPPNLMVLVSACIFTTPHPLPHPQMGVATPPQKGCMLLGGTGAFFAGSLPVDLSCNSPATNVLTTATTGQGQGQGYDCD